MKIKTLITGFGSLLIPLIVTAQEAQHYTQYVDPFIGSQGGGNVFVGACQPFGMVKLGPDYEGHSNSGFREEGRIEGFSHTHTSGTGGGAKYGNVLLTAQSGALNVQDYASSREKETCTAGHYSVYLKDARVQVDLTAAVVPVFTNTHSRKEKLTFFWMLVIYSTPAANMVGTGTGLERLSILWAAKCVSCPLPK